MKYLIYTLFYFPETNGVSQCVDHRCHYLANSGHKVTLIIPNYPNVDECLQVIALKEAGIELLTTPISELSKNDDSWFANDQDIDLIDKHLQNNQYDIFIVDEPMMLFMVSGFRIKQLKHLQKSCKTVAICHGILSKLYRHYGMNIAARQVDAIKDDIFGDYQLSAIPTQYVQHQYQFNINTKCIPFLGVNKNFYTPLTTPKNQQTFNILYVGRMAPEKNIVLLHEAAEELHALGYDNIIWHFVGIGPLYETFLERKHDYIHIYGELHGSALRNAYQMANVFISACTFEAFGLTVAEAMASGLPVITANSGGNAEQFSHQEEGFQFDPSSSQELINAITTLYNSPQLCKEMGDKARIRSQDWRDGCELLIKSINEIQTSKQL